MAPPLSPSIVTNILDLRRCGISIREIARRLGVHRETVGKYLGRLESQISKGDAGSDVVATQITDASTKRTGPLSCCEPFRELIIDRLNQGLTAQKIFQYLVNEHGFKARYYSVRRYVAKLLDEKRSSSNETFVTRSPQSHC